jgi:hypothetical protein
MEAWGCRTLMQLSGSRMDFRNGLTAHARIAGVLVAMLMAVSGAAAQQPIATHGSATVQGIVLDVQSGQPISRARVTIAGTGVVRLSDNTGRFVRDSMPSGSQTLEVRAIGFRPSNQPLVLTDGERITVRIEMITIPVRLDTVRTRASSQDIASYERRRDARIGTYYDRADIARMKVFDPTDVLRHALRVRVDFDVGAPSVKTGGGVHPRCDPDLWIDGRWRRDVLVGEMDNFVPLDQIEHIEIYTDSFTIPSDLVNLKQGGKITCGAVVVWTSSPPKKKPAAPVDSLLRQ